MKTSSIIALVVIALFAVFMISNFLVSTSAYVDFAYAKKTQSEVHVVAKWVRRDESVYDKSRDQFSFYLQDSLNNIAHVIYSDPKPANFENADKIVVIGKYQDTSFVTDKILMKCPSKYEKKEL